MMISAFLLIFVLSGCVPNFGEQEEVIPEDKDTEEKAIVPNYQISDSYYRTISPFKPSDSRGTVLERLNSRYDSDEFEEGLLRIAQKTFSTEDYIFQDGQYLDKDTIVKWLSRKYTASQLKERNLSETDNVGLNPTLNVGKDEVAAHEKSPLYLSHILEHNYLVKTDGKKVKLAGISIGLALNSVYYYNTKDGRSNSVEISDTELDKQGKKIAEEIVQRLRKIEGLGSVPIVVSLYKQQERNSVIPGNFFSYGVVKKGTSVDWSEVNEQYVLFPSSIASSKQYRADFEKFEQFQNNVDKYFPNYNGVVGRAFYAENEIRKLEIDVTIQFFGKAETIGFAQYVAGLLVKSFPENLHVEINIKSTKGQEALILKEANKDEPFVYVY
ncbi:CamS family sex pheromone protein [Bacillus kwashiorkori]|uniref:CamS family sex pheromone protein n=1 Tax=Bacillus kwashiorkori TaxID=1522318 RepID=UPI000A850CFB